MTEAEWDARADPQPMLEFLRGRASDRKLRLFAVACCRRISHLLMDERSRRAVEVGEQYADEQITEEERETTAENAHAVDPSEGENVATAAWLTAVIDTASNLADGQWNIAKMTQQAVAETVFLNSLDDSGEKELAAQCDLLRCMFGPLPFRPIILASSLLTWTDATISKLAQGIYADRAFDRLPILADALEDAGCDNADMLAHCRSGGEHVRGCWVVDLILGKQ